MIKKIHFMNKIYLLFIWIILGFSSLTYCQQLEFEVMPIVGSTPFYTTEFDPNISNELRVFDFDSDGDLDVLGCDFTEDTYFGLVQLYDNDGFGNFREIDNNPFIQVERAFADIGDIDGDGDMDVLVTGRQINTPKTTLYRNDCGSFTIDQGSIFANYENGRVAFADIDNDLDQDVVLSGVTNPGTNYTRIYKNDGTGFFSIYDSLSLPVCYYGSIDFADVDNDNDPDVLMTGDSPSSYYSKLYINDGQGNFVMQASSPFTPVKNSNVEFGDIDNDSDLDVFILGSTTTGGYSTKKYINNGSGVFTFSSEPTITSVSNGNLQLGDVDFDNDLDLFVAGNNSSLQPCKLYRNNGLGSFTFTSGDSFNWYNGKAMDVFDVNNDGSLDLVTINARTNSFIHFNNGSGNLSSVSNSSITRVMNSASDIGDIDGDNDQDLLISGTYYAPGSSSPSPITSLYINNGIGNYSVVAGTPFQDVHYGDIDFADVNNDGNLDVFICGATINASIKSSKLFLNNGAGGYTLSSSVFEGVSFSSSFFGDIDGDNDLDLLVSGSGVSNVASTKLYLNNGFGDFTEDLGCSVIDLKESNIGLSDLDNDSDLDLLITGVDQSSQYHSKMYTNNGGTYALVNGTPFINLKGPFDFADIDGDNDNDIFITGSYGTGSNASVYLNQGNNIFTISPNNIPPYSFGATKFFDVDLDNDLDLFVSGTSMNDRISSVFQNDGQGIFSIVNNLPFLGTNSGDVSIGNINNDLLPDIVITGQGSVVFCEVGQIYIQNPCKNIVQNISASSCTSFQSSSGNVYSISGVYYEYYTSASGCDSTIRYCVNILNDTTPSTTNIVACDEFISDANQSYTASGLYTETFTNIFGCDSLAIFDLTINNGTSSTFSLTSCSPFTSPLGNVYTNSGTYYETTVNSVGCDSLIEIILEIETINNNVIQTGQLLTAEQSGLAYQWIDCNNLSEINGEINNSYSPINNGSYAVVLNGSFCSDTSDCFIMNINDIDKLQSELLVTAYPNPAINYISLKVPIEILGYQFNIFDPQGRLLFSGETKSETNIVDIEFLSSGLYLLKINGETIQFMKL